MKRLAAVSCGLLFALGCSGGSSSSDAHVSSLNHIPVDRPGLSHTPTRDSATAQTMKYFGGPVIPNAKVYVVCGEIRPT